MSGLLSYVAGGVSSGGITLTGSHDSQPQGIIEKLQSIPKEFLFMGVSEKAFQELNDIKYAVETGTIDCGLTKNNGM